MKKNSDLTRKDILAGVFVILLGSLINPALLILVLIVVAVFAGLWLVGWLQYGFEHRIASTMLWAAAMACAFIGFIVYGLQVDPNGTGWPSMVFFCITLLSFPVGVLHALFSSGWSSSNGNNWRNAGDRDSDPDNHIWAGNPSHND